MPRPIEDVLFEFNHLQAEMKSLLKLQRRLQLQMNDENWMAFQNRILDINTEINDIQDRLPPLRHELEMRKNEVEALQRSPKTGGSLVHLLDSCGMRSLLGKGLVLEPIEPADLRSRSGAERRALPRRVLHDETGEVMGEFPNEAAALNYINESVGDYSDAINEAEDFFEEVAENEEDINDELILEAEDHIASLFPSLNIKELKKAVKQALHNVLPEEQPEDPGKATIRFGSGKITMTKKQFLKEHRNLLKVLKEGKRKALKKEYEEQKKEMSKYVGKGNGDEDEGLVYKNPMPPVTSVKVPDLSFEGVSREEPPPPIRAPVLPRGITRQTVSPVIKRQSTLPQGEDETPIEYMTRLMATVAVESPSHEPRLYFLNPLYFPFAPESIAREMIEDETRLNELAEYGFRPRDPTWYDSFDGDVKEGFVTTRESGYAGSPQSKKDIKKFIKDRAANVTKMLEFASSVKGSGKSKSKGHQNLLRYLEGKGKSKGHQNLIKYLKTRGSGKGLSGGMRYTVQSVEVEEPRTIWVIHDRDANDYYREDGAAITFESRGDAEQFLHDLLLTGERARQIEEMYNAQTPPRRR